MSGFKLTARHTLTALLAVASATRLAAQDMTISPLQWTDSKGAPDVLPVLKDPPRFSCPEEMRNADQINYVVVEYILDPQGRHLGSRRSATAPALVRVLESGVAQLKFSPGLRDGKAVNTSVSFALLFNPASAAEKPDASPRLLEVTTATLPRPKGSRPDAVIEDRVVSVDVAIDEAGHIAEVKHAPEEYAGRIRIAAKNWRFAPARRGGQPVAAELRVPFVLVTPGGAKGGGKSVPPRPVFQARPIYPMAMRASGIRGEVIVDFVVDIEGRVRNAFALRSLNPAFDDPAIDAVRKWRFEPGRMGERPVPTHMQVPIVFTLDGTAEGGRDGLTVKKGDLSKLPEAFRYDTPPRLTGLVRPVYPYEALQAGREGHAVVRYAVSEAGRVVDAQVGEASDPEFGRSLVAAVEQFSYEPAQKAGRPCKALLAFRQDFRRDESFQLVSDLDQALLAREKKKPQTILNADQLDGKLAPVSRRPPIFPLSEMGRVETGGAVIEVVVDEDGRARLPRVVSATSEAFGHAALSGLSSWRFEPPTRGGRAVAVRVRVPVSFKLERASPGKK